MVEGVCVSSVIERVEGGCIEDMRFCCSCSCSCSEHHCCCFVNYHSIENGELTV